MKRKYIWPWPSDLPWAPNMVALTVDRIFSCVPMVGIRSHTCKRFYNQSENCNTSQANIKKHQFSPLKSHRFLYHSTLLSFQRLGWQTQCMWSFSFLIYCGLIFLHLTWQQWSLTFRSHHCDQLSTGVCFQSQQNKACNSESDFIR